MAKKENRARGYSMDLESLRKGHADATRMLAELDQREGCRRRSLDSSDGTVGALDAEEE